MSDYMPDDRDFVLGLMMLNPKLVDVFPYSVDFFFSQNQRTLWTAIQELSEAGRPISLPSIVELRGHGFISYLNAITSGVIHYTPAQFRRQVYKLEAKRLKNMIVSKIGREAKSENMDYDGVMQMVSEVQRLEREAESEEDPILRYLFSGTQLQALDIKVDWTLDKLIPSNSITLLHGPGGVGKTWLALAFAKAVSEGRPFLGLSTRQRSVNYIDFENPWPMLIERVRRMDICDVLFWHLSAERRPPKLDKRDWEIYKKMPKGSLLIFDTARASHDGDENSSQDASLVMNRFKEIREAGFDILLLHHTPKLNEQTSKGSTAWYDLADQDLAFYRIKRGAPSETDEEGYDPDAILFLGTGKKTRYEPARYFITLDAARGKFSLATDPYQEKFEALAKYISEEGRSKNQGEIVAWGKDDLGLSRAAVTALLKRGEREGRWQANRGPHGRLLYEPTA